MKTDEVKNIKHVINGNHIVIPIETGYIKPNDNLNSIIDPAKEIMEDGDYLVIAETPISVSQGRLIDEAEYTPSLTAKFLTTVWSKYLWGYVFGPALKIKERTIKNLRRLPKETEAHKEVVLQLYGLKHALKPASEAGIDLSNAPGTCVSLLPENPEKVAKDIKREIGKEVCVMIIDTDATYMKNGKYFTGLPIAIEGIDADNGFFGYVKGQLSENMGSTPLGCSEKMDVESALKIANIAEDYQKSLSTEMKTIHSVKAVLGSEIDEVTIEDLDSITHTPAVIIREI
ncbi:MAG: coenzyme F420-0:L-glutamate ligase [Methanobrevibacter sp.]|uniref:coenzyme F420-0:L-glutamate ligase n=1 Tax=Methanobrevibacter sp. TaxID=66852 RepID=UPI002579DFCA|nr:coenzyme F420-0:L-glutamate ligase [Methanobrevibacter sp.]MBR2665388.1 coenzyme F420-0:L-glutamate ligase [Methanobrevibacter sp.]MBR3197072.1 coenzyme F420-0:L-glutamate ligase [Methanobrevibacter sp.]MBR6927535.1 coenzyme F420-0:L-glutamate ligase [Methanobrevibacter sp.]MBR7049955.1 coenzyme F420-0:L-glutamate ligase [Methanobrevibacter sp.]